MPRPNPITARASVDPAALPRRTLYRTLRSWLRPPATRYFPLTVAGAENLPPRGPYIIAANHHNYLDGVVLGLAVPEPIAFLVMPRVYRATPLHPPFHDRIGSIPINLERPDVGGLRRALGALERGAIVGIFPEGPFSVRGRLEHGLPGVGLLALRARVPVVPAAIRGTYQALAGRRFYLPRRHPVAVRFGTARRFHGEVTRGRPARAAVTRRIMDDIAALLER
jgi:1-acyl-sn-glycerol-3-phosphate acyltransferase